MIRNQNFNFNYFNEVQLFDTDHRLHTILNKVLNLKILLLTVTLTDIYMYIFIYKILN